MSWRVRAWLRSGLIAILLVAACTGDDDGEDTGAGDTGGGGGAGGPVPGSTDPVDSGCSEGFPSRLQPQAQLPEEEPYVDRITVCQDELGTSTAIVNGTEVVWYVARPLDANVEIVIDSEEARSFAEFAASDELILPGAVAVVDAPGDQVSWYLDGRATAGWIAHHRIFEEATSHGEDALIDVLSAGSTARRAVLQCVDAAQDVAGDDLQNLDAADPMRSLLEGMGVASSTASCGAALQKAGAEYRARQGATVPAWTDDVVRWSDDLDAMSRYGSILDDAYKFLRFVGPG